MTDTTAPTWLQALQVSSLGQSVLVVVTALATLLSTLGVQWLSAPKMTIPAADRPAISKQIDDAANRIDGRLTEILGTSGLCVDLLQQHAKDYRTPKAAPRPAAVK